MEPLYGSGTDPVPYFLLAYGAGTLLLLGFAAWALRDRMRLRQLLATLASPQGETKRT